MSRRAPLRMLLAACVLGIASCAPVPESIEQASPSHPQGPPLLPASARELHEAFARTFRPKPDRRLLLAIADVHHVLTRFARVEVEHEFFEGKWHLRYLGQEVGALPEYPDFADMVTVLTAWATHVERDRPLKLDATPPRNETADVVGHEAAFDLLQRSQIAFNNAPSREKLHDATRAIVSLATQLLDDTEIADSVLARALALLAIDRGVGHSASVREEAMLAGALGFSSAQKPSAAKLPDDDPVRAFCEGDDATLAKLANDPRHDGARLLHLRLLANGDFVGAEALRTKRLRDRVLSLAVLADRLRAHDPDESHVAHALVSIAMLNVAREASMAIARRAADDVRPLGDSNDQLAKATAFISGWLEIQREETVGRMEPELPKVGLGDAGPFMDTATHQAFYRAFAFSALHRLSTRAIETHVPAATLLDSLRGAKSPAAASFREWYVKLADAQLRKTSVPDLFVKQESLSALGGRLSLELLSEIARHEDWTNPAFSAAAKRVMPRIDTRPSHRRMFAALARHALLDRDLAERLEKSLDSAPSVLVARKGDPLVELATQLEAKWKNGELDRAAESLAAPPLALRRVDFRRVVGPRFAEAFAEDDKAIAAFDALAKSTLSSNALLEIASALDDRKRHALAFRLADRIEAKGAPSLDHLELAMRVHAFAVRAGERDADERLLRKIPETLRKVAHVAAFGEGEDGVFPKLAGKTVAREGEGELVWLLRAASARRSGDDAMQKTIRAALETKGSSDFRRMARHLVGLEDEASVLSIATSPQRACEVAFYLGVRARAEGRTQDANDWFRAAVDTGNVASAEHRWAFSALESSMR